jgi:hypothetical protein
MYVRVFEHATQAAADDVSYGRWEEEEEEGAC